MEPTNSASAAAGCPAALVCSAGGYSTQFIASGKAAREAAALGLELESSIGSYVLQVRSLALQRGLPAADLEALARQVQLLAFRTSAILESLEEDVRIQGEVDE